METQISIKSKWHDFAKIIITKKLNNHFIIFLKQVNMFNMFYEIFYNSIKTLIHLCQRWIYINLTICCIEEKVLDDEMMKLKDEYKQSKIEMFKVTK